MVVEVEPDTEVLGGVDAELRIDMVFSLLLVATVVISDVGIGRQRVQEQELVWLSRGVAIGIGEEKLADHRTVCKDAVLTGRIVVAYGVVLTIDACIVDGVLKQMVQRVHLRRNDVAEPTV